MITQSALQRIYFVINNVSHEGALLKTKYSRWLRRLVRRIWRLV